MLWSFLNQLTVNTHEWIQTYKVLPYLSCYAADVHEKSQSIWNYCLEKLHWCMSTAGILLAPKIGRKF